MNREVLYDRIGGGYADFRQPDPRIEAALADALTGARTVANIGAGAGSYEPKERCAVAIEPSITMVEQRGSGLAPCARGVAELLPLADGAVDAAMAVLTAHHWSDLGQGLREMARVSRQRFVLLTWVPDSPAFWLTRDYFPEIVAYDKTIFPSTATLHSLLDAEGCKAEVKPVPIPHDCTDGFLCSYWRRPEAYLNAQARHAISSFARIDAAAGLARLYEDLESGHWQDRNRSILQIEELDLGYRLVCCELLGGS